MAKYERIFLPMKIIGLVTNILCTHLSAHTGADSPVGKRYSALLLVGKVHWRVKIFVEVFNALLWNDSLN